MVAFSKAELLNEVSQIFRAGLDPGVEGGTLNTSTEYLQLLELVSTTLLFNPDGVFYLAKMAANRLNSLVISEVAILEDLLVLLEDLGKVGSAVRDTASLNNARTAVLALDAASSVTNRPETQRFTRQMDAFAAQLKTNVVSQERGNILVRPREEARNVIQENLQNLGPVHARLLTQITALKDVLDNYLALDIPSRVSTSVLASVNQRLQDAVTAVATTTDTANLESNRDLFLQTLANKVAVKLLGSFTDPSDLKFRSPKRPIPATLTHTGKVVGEGEPAAVLTSAGPWPLPISAPLELSVSGAAPASISLDGIVGSFIAGRNPETFEVAAGRNRLHVTVAPEIITDTISGISGTQLTLSNYHRLGFKHLGAPVAFLEPDLTDPDDANLRFITALRPLQSLGLPITYSGGQVTASGFTGIEEGAIGFTAAHVGMVLMDASLQQFEIIQVLGTNVCVIDPRNATPDFSTAGTLWGSFASGSGDSRFYFLPALTNPPSGSVAVGPATKTAEFTVGTRDVADLISDIEGEAGPFPANAFGSTLNWHVKAEAVPNSDPPRLALRVRSKDSPFAQISGRFVNPQEPAGPATLVEGSAHTLLGFLEGELDDAGTLTPAELADTVSAVSGLVAEVETTEVYSGTLNTLVDQSVVEDAGKSFASLGVAAGDQIEILTGSARGVSQIVSLPAADQLTLDRDVFLSSEVGLSYRIFREQVRISLESAGPGSYLEVVSAPTELEVPVGVVYSSIPQFEAVDKLGAKLAFSGVVPGDLLRIVGDSTEYAVVEVQDGTRLVLDQGLPSSVNGAGFEIRSAASQSYKLLNSRLTTYVTSPNLLRKNNFHQGVEAIDNAVTLAVLPGRNFIASRNQARRMVADLLSILSTDLKRQDEYDASVPEAPTTLADILAEYSAPEVPALDNILDTLKERKYERAAALLQQARITEFYDTDDETASYGGALMSTSRAVVNDLPRPSRTRRDFLDQRDIANESLTTTDAGFDFSDTEDEPGTPDI